MSTNNKIEASMEAAFEHAQEHLDACVEKSQNTEIAKGTYTFPENPHGSGMVRDPDNGRILFVGILVYNLTLQDGGYMLIGGNDSPDALAEEQGIKEIIQGLFQHMLNRPLIELNALVPERLCSILNMEISEENLRCCTFVLLGFRQAFAQYLQSE